jgi:hypothetical protein
VWCGDGARDLHDLAVAVFSSAARRNERMLFVAEQPRLDWLTGLSDLHGLVAQDALRLIRVDDIYSHPASPQEQQAQFEQELDQALVDGYSGVCVVADNTRLIGTTDDEFRTWLIWEALADQLQATRPISGACYFDRIRVSAERLGDLAIMHPIRCADVDEPGFQIFCDDDQLRVTGEIDGIGADQIRRTIGATVDATRRDLDFSEVTFIDHRALLTLEELARSAPPVRVKRASSIVHRLWRLLDLPAPALELC